MPTSDLQPRPTRWPAWKVVLCILVVWTIPPALFVHLEQGERSFGEAVALQASLWYPWAFATPLIMWLVRRLPVRRDGLLARGALHAVAGIAVSATICYAVHVLHGLITDEYAGDESSFLMYLVWTLFTYGVVLAVVSAIDSGFQARMQQYHAGRLETLLARARLDALRAQLQPHFLFNTLNAIASLVRQEQTDRAVETIARLSDLLRHVLDTRDRPVISLSEEMDFVEEYLAIERARFEDRMTVDISIEPDATRCSVPTFILQPIVENAIKHGIAASREGGTIIISARRADGGLEITIANDRGSLPADGVARREGVGLANTRARLHEQFGEEASLEIEPAGRGGARVVIRVPCEGDA